MNQGPLSPDDIAHYRTHGWVAAPGIIPTDDVVDMAVGLDRLLCTRLPGTSPSPRDTVLDDIHAKITALAHADRAGLGVVYDAARKLSAFWSAVGSRALNQASAQLLDSDTVGVGFRGCGIRMDLPREDRWRSEWHQEYQSQMSSQNALVAWFSLVPVTTDMGPVRVLDGSHREGILPVRALDPHNTRKDYTRTFELTDIHGLTARYPEVSRTTAPGDVIFLDFLTVHASGWNRSDGRSRVTCQVRYFDMTDPSSLALGWRGGWQDGGDFTRAHPDKVIPGEIHP